MGWQVRPMVLAVCLIVARMATAAEAPIRVVVWDEQQPSQKEAYDNFLGNRIAAHLRAQPGFDVRSLSLNDAEHGLSQEILDFAEVMFWWGHQKQAAVKPEVGKAIVERVKAGRLTLVALHSAHWATPFIEAMNERARLDVQDEWAGVPADKLTVEEVPAPDQVLVEECWEPGEWFRSVMVWDLGKGQQVVYIRPGHETFPIFKDEHMLRLIENAARCGRSAGE